jgi:predicted secreted protein
MKNLKLFLSVLFLSILITGCAEKPVLVVQAVQGEQSVTAKTGVVFTIQLKGRMSTGYSWKAAELPASFQVIKENVTTLEKNIAGGEDIQEFTYSPAEKGDFTITFRYAEHWKKRPKYLKTATVKVKVE